MEKKTKFYGKWQDAPETIPRKIEDIVGKTPVDITVQGKEQIVFLFDDDTACEFCHDQQCCENVFVEDVNGDWGDLIGIPLLVAEERTNSDLPKPETDYSSYGSNTWTFYTFRSIKGSVDVRWYGESNGFYSERVDFFGGIWES